MLQPACDWITTQPLPSARQRERMREGESETPGKKEMRKEINKESRHREPGGGWKRNGGDETEREHKIKIIFPISLCSPSHIYYHSTLNRFTLCVACVGYLSCGPLSISLLPSSAKKIYYTQIAHSSALHPQLLVQSLRSILHGLVIPAC